MIFDALTAIPHILAAVSFLLPGAPKANDIFLRPDILLRADRSGGDRTVRGQQARIVVDLLFGSELALLKTQSQMGPNVYGVAALGRTSTTTSGEHRTTNRMARGVQRAYLDRVEKIRTGEIDPATAATARFEMAHRIQAILNADASTPGSIPSRFHGRKWNEFRCGANSWSPPDLFSGTSTPTRIPLNGFRADFNVLNLDCSVRTRGTLVA